MLNILSFHFLLFLPATYYPLPVTLVSAPPLNPISLFGTILHAPPPTSFTAFLALNVANFTSVKRADVYLTDLLNTFVL